MKALPFEVILDWILRELEQRESIFGIHRSLFYEPRQDAPYAVSDCCGHHLSTPIGPAAGPHTQLAQNIVSAWLCGGRFIELKTVQVRDELVIPRPCIDMEDEGYNVEWSQELKLDQSADEYIKAWVLTHILHRLLGFENRVPPGTIFNMSIGYDLEGIKGEPMTRFLDRMKDASAELDAIRAVLRARFPQFADIEIPSQISDSVTLSTMHACPPEEIERIVRYLLDERGLHTTVKLNPTLLGKRRVLGILHEDLGFREIQVPDAVFRHDLRYDRAVELIKSLQRQAAGLKLTFGVKLSNTLAAVNHKGRLPGKEMYLSGRALYPLTINLFRKLVREFNGDLNVSYSGGADALNVSALLACGARPVTAATDLLKPGGYARFLQYLGNLAAEMRDRGVASLDELARNKLANLEQAAAEALVNPRYHKSYYLHGLPRVDSGLGLFDCIAAPCVEQCAVRQDVPEYARLIAQGEYDRALAVVLARNPLPGVTGYICTQLCRTCCTRSASNYDEPVGIRDLKRFAVEKGRVAPPGRDKLGRRVAIIGGGPSGLSVAYFLALSGIQATIFEARNVLGGMMRLAPAFRLPRAIIQEDVERIVRMGVAIEISRPITHPPERLLKDGFDAVYIASGFQKDAPLRIEGIEGKGVVAALDFLEQTRRGNDLELGARVLVIGGGNTAMDAARTAQRLTGHPVTVVYRRTRKEMPAGEEDIEGAFEEGIHLQELVSPIRVVLRGGRVAALDCIRNRLGKPGPDGRRRPIPIEGSEFQIAADSIIVAVGQSADLTFLNGSAVRLRKEGSIKISPATGLAGVPHVYAGGDVVAGPASIVAACADGRRAAEAICTEFGIEFRQWPSVPARLSEKEILDVKGVRARREAQHRAARVPPGQRGGFDLIEATLSEEAARREAVRCLQCSTVCDKCVEVCPNRANRTYHVSPVRLELPRLSCRQDVLVITGETVFQVGQSRQIIHLHDLCNNCGNCATFCVHKGRPHEEKPRLFLNADDFERESLNAFYVENNKGGWIIRRCERGRQSQLAMRSAGGEMIYESDLLQLVISRAEFRIMSMALRKQFRGDLALDEPAEMYVIAQGVIGTLPFLF